MYNETNNLEIIHKYEYLRRRYRIKYNDSKDYIEWEELVKLNWWQRRFRTDGQTYVWKLIYKGPIIPIQMCIQTTKNCFECINIFISSLFFNKIIITFFIKIFQPK